MASSDGHHTYMEFPAFSQSHIMPWIAEEDAKVFPSHPSVPECCSHFDMLLAEDNAWLVQRTEATTPPMRDEGLPHCKEAGQCPVIDSRGREPCPGTNGQVDMEDRCLEQVHTLVVEEVLKDIETACKLLNITPAAWMKERCSPENNSFLGDKPRVWWVPGPDELCAEADSSCTGQPIHLWQFLRELLLKPHNYGRSIRWLNKEKGIFKIEDSAHVAKLWGIRKNRPAMNYDKLSRSIRQYYKKGIIKKPDVSQRLVYQFVHPV
ncbi:hypothetical protein P4O66_022585 [Electrophorus voltai]|uniref:ETS domain-containing protein n=1 Tax=Electrophorus voltai TaxID=2609070 RepID=A0AAD8ZR03_9TELE|nr:hypothetical protein P4O66_022585 [Electrophorus voltai]